MTFGAGDGSLMHGVAMLKSTLIVDVPLGERRIPNILKALTALLMNWSRTADRALLTRDAVTDQFQAPCPPTGIGRGEKSATVKACPPLLAGVARLIAIISREDRMTTGFIRSADARPVRSRQPFRDVVLIGHHR
jgi:hypothetical protein